MACPDYQAFMLPVLQVLSDGVERRLPELRLQSAQRLGLGPIEMAEKLSSGRRLAYEDRANWACTYLTQAGLVEWVRRGVYRISPVGAKLVASKPLRVDLKYLLGIDEFRGWYKRSKEDDGDDDGELAVPSNTATPEEQLEAGYQSVRAAIENELLQRILGSSPEFFENLVVELLVAMGYGGSLRDAGQALGRSGDGGIDGIIKEDKLGLDAIYIQAKRWDVKRKVSRPDVQAFAGSLEGFRARKGVFITTSAFSSEAHDYVARIEKRIILIDGAHLVRLLFEHGVGVRTKRTYEVKEVDDEYFIDD